MFRGRRELVAQYQDTYRKNNPDKPLIEPDEARERLRRELQGTADGYNAFMNVRKKRIEDLKREVYAAQVELDRVKAQLSVLADPEE